MTPDALLWEDWLTQEDEKMLKVLSLTTFVKYIDHRALVYEHQSTSADAILANLAKLKWLTGQIALFDDIVGKLKERYK